MTTGRADDDFTDFVRAGSAALVRMAWVMTGDEQSARDAVQVALAKTWNRWGSVRRRDAPEVYVRRVIVTTVLSWRRRRAYNQELPTASVAERGETRDEIADLDLRLSVAAALAKLPARQRAVIVLRYLEDLSEQDTASVMGCSVGTVKSHTSRAMLALREGGHLRSVLESEVEHERR